MKTTRILAASLALLATSPVSAWEFGMSEKADAFWTIAEDGSGETRLAFFCGTAAPGAVLLQIAIEQPGPSGRVPVELGFEINGSSFGPIAATAETVDGSLVVTSNGRSDALDEVARAAYGGSDGISLTYYENTWRYPGADYADAFSAMLDACG